MIELGTPYWDGERFIIYTKFSTRSYGSGLTIKPDDFYPDIKYYVSGLPIIDNLKNVSFKHVFNRRDLRKIIYRIFEMEFK